MPLAGLHHKFLVRLFQESDGEKETKRRVRARDIQHLPAGDPPAPRGKVCLSATQNAPRRRTGLRSRPKAGPQGRTINEASPWKRSFDCLLASPAGQSVFMEFLRTEHSDENMAFWLACEELKREQSEEQVCEKAKKIYLDYISILSPKEVSIDATVRESINRSLARPSVHIFNEAQAQVYALMHRDSYPRFLSSPLYKSLEQRLAALTCDA
uniref:RGS domain-containing protein n=1 Tax=Chelydra serpentina TaxID=8475 RepID=A0A8C3SI31_CHESE